MDRRQFIASALALATVPAIPIKFLSSSTPAFADVTGYAKLMQAFPTYKNAEPVIHFFVGNVSRKNQNDKNSQYVFNILKQDASKSTSIEDVLSELSDNIEIIDGTEPIRDWPIGKSILFNAERATNKIARKTLRGKGQYYFFNEVKNEIVFFYGGSSVYDTPIISDTTGYLKNEASTECNFYDYFAAVKVKSKEDYEEFVKFITEYEWNRFLPYTQYHEDTVKRLLESCENNDKDPEEINFVFDINEKKIMDKTYFKEVLGK